MKVKTKRPHGNPHGEKYWKQEGDVYELPDSEAPGLINARLVEEAKPTPARRPRRRKAGNEPLQD